MFSDFSDPYYGEKILRLIYLIGLVAILLIGLFLFIPDLNSVAVVATVVGKDKADNSWLLGTDTVYNVSLKYDKITTTINDVSLYNSSTIGDEINCKLLTYCDKEGNVIKQELKIVQEFADTK